MECAPTAHKPDLNNPADNAALYETICWNMADFDAMSPAHRELVHKYGFGIVMREKERFSSAAGLANWLALTRKPI